MTKDQIIDYLYFFWAPLLKANAINENERNDFQKIIILTLSQASVHIEAPGYIAGTSSRDFTEEITHEIDKLADRIVATIPVRTAEDSYWLQITPHTYFVIDVIETHLEPEFSFGPYRTDETKFIGFHFYYVPYQLQIQLPATAEPSAIISAKKPFPIQDGIVTNIDLDSCSLWLSAIHFDTDAGNASLYTGMRLKHCHISFDSGYAKSGNKITAGLINSFAGFTIACVPEDVISESPAITIAGGNKITYPGKFVFSFKHSPGLPQPPKISLTHTEPFAATLFGSAVASAVADNVIASWVADKNLLSFPLPMQDDTFAATENSSAIFNFRGVGRINNLSWYFQPVSITHPLGFSRLGIASDDGYLGFESKDEYTLSWDGLENGPLKLKDFFIRASARAFFLRYTFKASVFASQKLQLWKGNNSQKIGSVIDIDYTKEGKGNFISHIATEQNAFNTTINVNIDQPLHSNGDRIFLKTSGDLIFIKDKNDITAVVLGRAMDPAIAFENSFFRQLNSFALSNALILVNPVKLFLLAGRLNATGTAAEGQCIIQFPVPSVEHTLPDPYITTMFDEQRDGNVQPTRSLLATVRWNEADDAELIMQLADENGKVFTPKSTLTDDQFADILLHFPLQHPAERDYEALLKNAVSSKLGNIPVNIDPDGTPYGNYQSFYQSKTNTAGAFSALHILPGNTALVDVSGRASQMGIAFSGRLDHAENGIQQVLENTGYTFSQTYRIENNEVVSSGRFVRAFTLPHVQWEPVYFEEKILFVDLLLPRSPFPSHGVPTRISSANKADVTLAPIPVTKYIVEGFRDEKKNYAAAAHFALPFGMNAVALFHPFVDGVELPSLQHVRTRIPDPYSYSTVNFNQPGFNLKKGVLTGAIQIRVTSEGLPKIPRDEIKFPDPSFHGSVVQMPGSFEISNPPLQYKDDSILGIPITKQFNKVMWGEYFPEPGINPLTLKFKRSPNAKVPLRRIDFSGFGASVFSNWLNKHATAGSVSQVKFNILIGRVAHEVVQIKSVIIPWFIPVVRTLIIERKNQGHIIRTDTGWVATGPGEFHDGYTWHPGVIQGVENVTSIKDTNISLQHNIHDNTIVEMAGVYFDADVKIENVVNGFKNTNEPAEGNFKPVPSKKQFGYILLGNPDDGVSLKDYFTDADLREFMLRPDVGALGGPVDCVVNIAGSDQMMHLTRVDVSIAANAKASVAAVWGTLQLPKGGSWAVVKKITNGATLPLTNDETVPLIRNGILQFDAAGNPESISFNNSLHVLGNPSEIEKYATGLTALADTEYALLQSTDTQKLLFPRPSFNSKNNSIINDGITEGLKQIFITDPVLADPYSLLKSNTIFPDKSDALTLQNVDTGVLANTLDIDKGTEGISFPDDISDALQNFIPPECNVAGGRKLTIVKAGTFEIYLDYGDDLINPRQLFNVALNGKDDANRWRMTNKNVAIVVNIDVFQPLLTVKGSFNAEPGKNPEFTDATIVWNENIDALKKIIQVLTILYQLSKADGSEDVVKKGFSFTMGNSPDSWSYKCTIEEKIPVIKFPNPIQLALLPGPAPLIIEAGLGLGVFFNMSLSADPANLIKPGAGLTLSFESTIQVLMLTIEVATAYGVGTARVDIFIELPDAKPTFKFTMGFGATVAVQLPVVGYVSVTRVISLGAAIDNGMVMTVGQMLRGVLTIASGLASVSIQVEASGTVTNKGGEAPLSEWTAIVRGVFTLDVTVAYVLSWDFSKDFEHEIDLPDPF